MSETEKKAETPEQARSSYVETPPPTSAEKVPPTPAAGPEPELFKLLREIRDAMTEKKNGITHQLCRIADALEKIPQGVPAKTPPCTARTPAATPPPAAPAAAPAPSQTPSFLADTQAEFPKDLQDMLLFEQKDGYIRIKPRQYLGSENFAKIAAIVREIGGEYVSAGKDSHFRRAPEEK